MEKLDIKGLPEILENDINVLLNAISNGEEFLDCELSELRADINQCESCHLIDGYTAKLLRDYYIKGGIENG